MARPRKSAINYYVGDLETSTWLEESAYVWAWAIMGVESEQALIGSSIQTLMNAIVELPKSSILGFHNLKFDGAFIVSWLLENGYEWNESRAWSDRPEKSFKTLIADSGQWYSIDIKADKYHGCVIHDTLKKLPFSVEQLAKKLGFEEKGKIDYSTYRAEGGKLSRNDKEYLLTDCRIVAKGLKEMFFKNGMYEMTLGSDCLKEYKSLFKGFKEFFPVLSEGLDWFARRSYKGGSTQTRGIKNVGRGCTVDANSMYPSVMHSKSGNLYPYGMPRVYVGMYEHDDDYPLFIQEIEVDMTIKKDHIPTIQVKGCMAFADNEYIESTNGEPQRLYLTNVDLELMFKHYEIHSLKYIRGQKYKGMLGLFDSYINKWYKIKQDATRSGDKVLRELAKLMLNNLYGKFGLSIEADTKIPYLKENGVLGLDRVKNTRKPVYVPVASFCTSYARRECITVCQDNYEYYRYMDTDSGHFECTPDKLVNIKLHDDELCYWKIECEFDMAKYIRQKTYAEHIIVLDGTPVEQIFDKEKNEYMKPYWDFKCCGLSSDKKKLIKIEEFDIGMKIEGGKLSPKRVKGGINLVEKEFNIRAIKKTNHK